ncbi:ATP-binding protein [Lutibaculum baratangense]|uniref:AAA+ ATPase domain-containing protein n=1 Tax=Lutibaculum baratangense AMV1 TaxID=631454 RepID=V4RP72_9HYPH|nr:ATP-binding protein [Lutibaculum baratangense]ESR27069.1 hypothetical protein N177_0351 [Lutibaculum baratangense AMV1]
MSHDREDDDEEFDLDLIPDDPKMLRPTTDRILADLALAEALSPKVRAALAGDHGTVVVIRVPTAAWAPPIASAAKRLNPQLTVDRLVGSQRGAREMDVGCTIEELTRGRSVALVTHDPQNLLPPELAATVDVTVDLVPDRRLLADVIERITGKRPRGLKDRDLRGLDLPDICAAIRRGSTPSDCTRRLRAASQKRTAVEIDLSVPHLRNLPLFGEAEAWAIEAMREGTALKNGEAGAQPEYTLLAGPPGTGKTLLARSLARSLELPFFESSVAQWFGRTSGHLDGVVKAATAFFDLLAASAPAVGFLDELDAGPNRARMSSRNRDFWTPVVTGLLLEIDRLRRSGSPVLLIAATNHADALDAALVRAGRFGRHVLVHPPRSADDLCRVLRYHPAPAPADHQGADEPRPSHGGRSEEHRQGQSLRRLRRAGHDAHDPSRRPAAGEGARRRRVRSGERRDPLRRH